MTTERIIHTRAVALYNKLWKDLGSDPQWLRDVLQNNPDIFSQLLKAFTSKNPAEDFSRVVSQVQVVARTQARAAATAQANSPPFTVEWVDETLEYQ